MNTESKWQKMTSIKEHYDEETWTVPIEVGSSIWFAQTITESGGMVEYHPYSDTTDVMIDYPEAFGNIKRGWRGIVSCKYKERFIVVLRWNRGCGFVFDTKTHEFLNPFSFQNEITKFGIGESCVAIGDYIHILHEGQGEKANSDYMICSMIDQTSRKFRGPHLAPSLQNGGGSQVIKLDECYQSSNKMLILGFIRKQTGDQSPAVIVELISKFAHFELLKFGGYSTNEEKYVDSFYIGTLKDQDPTKPVEWKLAPQYTLKSDMPFWGFGYIQHGPFIVTFGGVLVDPEDPGNYTDADSISILDLRKNCGWIQSPIKCPEKGICTSVTDDCGRVHLWYADSETHHCIQLCEVLPLPMWH